MLNFKNKTELKSIICGKISKYITSGLMASLVGLNSIGVGAVGLENKKSQGQNNDHMMA